MFDDPTSLYNIMKGNLRTGGSTGSNSGGNWFEKKAQSINNAIGTTGAAFASAVKDAKENRATANLLQDNKTRMNEIAKKYGYNTYHDVWDAREKAEKEGDTKTLELIDNTINPELQGQATANAEKATKKAQKYDYYRKNDTLSKMVNQDSGKFLGSAINTLSTATDVLGLTNGPLSNAVQGGIEGIADELEQNGLRDFDWNRARQNAISGAVSGAAVGAVNNGISGALAKRGGNLFKGGNAITSAMNNLGANTALGRGASTLATGAVRGGISGAVGGATGAGTSALLNGQDVVSNALQGAKQGFQSGVGTGAIMAGANSALNKTKFMQQMNQANQEWQDMGKNNIERIKNTLNDTEPTQTPTETPVQRLAQVAQPNETWDNVAKQAGYNDYDDVVKQFMKANPNTDTSANNVLEWMDNNPKESVTNPTESYKQTKRNLKATSLEDRAAEDLLYQLGTVPKPVAYADNMVDNVKQFMRGGLTTPEEWQMASDVITGRSGVLSKLHNNLMEQAGQIDTMSGKGNEYGNSIDDTIDYMITKKGIEDSSAKALKKSINAHLNSLPSRANGSITGTDDARDVMRVIRSLEDDARHYMGEDSRNNTNATPFSTRKADVLKEVAGLLEDRIYDKVPDATKVVTPDAISEIKNRFPDNQKWNSLVDEMFSGIKTGKDLRAAQKPYVQSHDYLAAVKKNIGTYGQRVGDAYGNALSQAVKKVPVVGGLLAQGTSTPFMQRRYADLNMARANRLRGEQIDLPSVKSVKEAEIVNNTPTPAPTPVATETPTDYNPATQIYNTIGRREGLTNAEQARTANYLTDAVQANNALMGNTYGDNSLESLVAPTASNSVYSNINGNLATATTANGNNGSYFQKTGDYWTDIIGDALTSAINDRDVTAFAQLYEMYQDQLANLQKNASSTSGQKLNTTQQRANAALTSWQRLSQMTPDLGYNLSNIPIIGGIATLGGNDYEGEAKSLAQQIGYMVSGANIKQEEAENIGKAYVPQPWDSENTRKLKLQRAYEIIQQYQNNIAE